jgi:repressor LexA
MLQTISDKDKKAFTFIRNTIIHRGESPTLKEINATTGGKSPRSASIVIDRLVNAGLLKKYGRKIRLSTPFTESQTPITTVKIPLIGSVPCGTPMFAEQNIEAYIPVSTALAKKGSQYFLLRASGNSMDRAGIQDGDILLVRQQHIANTGDKVVALIDDEATVKFFEQTPDAVILRPRSTNPDHRAIILTNNCQIQGVVVAVLPPDLY